jgi:hypothetical protein
MNVIIVALSVLILLGVLIAIAETTDKKQPAP